MSTAELTPEHFRLLRFMSGTGMTYVGRGTPVYRRLEDLCLLGLVTRIDKNGSLIRYQLTTNGQAEAGKGE